MDVPTEPGKYEGIDLATYLRIPALGRSDFLRLRDSPGAWRAWKDGLVDEETSEEATTGSAVHTALLEPWAFDERYVVAPYCHPKWKDETVTAKREAGECTFEGGRETLAAFHEEHPPDRFEYVTKKDVATCEAIREKVTAIEPVRAMLELGGSTEIVYVFRDPETGQLLKCKPDRVYTGNPDPNKRIAKVVSFDLKTTSRDVRPRGMASSMGYRFYHVQGLLALWALEQIDGEEDTAHVMLAVQTSRPWRVEAYRLADSARATAGDEVRRLLRLYAKCLERDAWPDSSGLLRLLELPTFYKETMTDDWFRRPGSRGIDEIPEDDKPF